MNWHLPNLEGESELVGLFALLSLVVILTEGPIFGPLLLVMFFAMLAHLFRQL